MKNKWIAALALAGLLLTTGAYAESTPSETAAPVQAEAAAEPQHQLKVTTKYRYFISQYHYIRERKVSYFDNVYAYNHGEYGLTPFASTVPEEYFVADENGHVTGLKVVNVAPGENGPFTRQPGTERVIPADLVLISVGFLHPDTTTLVDQLPVDLDGRGNVARNDKFATSQDGVFACGDAGRGQSLVVWAISEGRSCAAAVDEYLTGSTELPAPIVASKRPMMLPR